MFCPKCNFQIPDTMMPSFKSSSTILKKKKLTFEVGEGDRKKTFIVVEPTNSKRDEYIDLTTEMARMDAEKREAIMAINEKIVSFNYPKDGDASVVKSPQDVDYFTLDVQGDMDKVHAMPSPSNRQAVEFFLGPIPDDQWYEEEMVPSIVEKIILDCENELCNLDTVRKNMESLLPQTMVMSSKAFKR